MKLGQPQFREVGKRDHAAEGRPVIADLPLDDLDHSRRGHLALEAEPPQRGQRPGERQERQERPHRQEQVTAEPHDRAADQRRDDGGAKFAPAGEAAGQVGAEEAHAAILVPSRKSIIRMYPPGRKPIAR